MMLPFMEKLMVKFNFASSEELKGVGPASCLYNNANQVTYKVEF